MKYGLIGYSGRLGREVKTIFDEMNHQMVLYSDMGGFTKIDEPEVLIDCSLPDGFYKSLALAEENLIPLIVATTGLKNEHLERLKEISEKIPVVQSNNYSVGIQVLLKLVEQTKKIVPDWDIEVSETHHRFKKDKPSGTALMIKDKIGKDVNISSLRLGNISGDHEVYFGGLGETLTIKHSAISRRTFAEGILKSAEFILNQKKGLFTFTDVIFGKLEE